MNTDTLKHVYQVLLAGGSGTRLWPVSRQYAPKQLCKLFDNDSLLQLTVKRLQPLLDTERMIIVCGHEHPVAVEHDLREIGVDAVGKLLCEPCGRNTAPAVLLALSQVMRDDPDAIVCVFAADHTISKLDNFHADLTLAIDAAMRGYIVTFGIPPSYPETGYGYVESGTELTARVFKVRRFVEKPDFDTALSYLHAGNYFWNSGMFVFKASVMWREFRRLQPELFAAMEKIVVTDGVPDAKVYQKLPNISIDYAIMEKTDLTVVVPAQFLWSDIGSWKSLYDFMPKDQAANYVAGDVLAIDVERSLLFNSGGPLLVANHLRDAVVISTRDAVFISDMHYSQEVRDIVDDLKKLQRSEAIQPFCNQFDFGRMWVLEDTGKRMLVRVDVWPGHAFLIADKLADCSELICLGGTGILWSPAEEQPLEKNTVMMVNKMGNIVNTGTEKLELLLFMDANSRLSEI